MSAVFDVNNAVGIDRRTGISVFDGNFRKRCKNINVRNRAGRRLYAIDALFYSENKFRKQFIFKRNEVVARRQQFFLYLFEFGSYKAFAADKSLFSYVCIGYNVLAAVRNFDVSSRRPCYNRL